MIGGGIGALTTGPLISIGRRRAGMLTQLIAITGGCICMIERPDCFAVGRLLLGITAGHTNGVMVISIAETVPHNVIWQFGILINFYIVLGCTFCSGLAQILPTEQDKMMEDETWRIILGMPIIIGTVNILLFLIFFR